MQRRDAYHKKNWAGRACRVTGSVGEVSGSERNHFLGRNCSDPRRPWFRMTIWTTLGHRIFTKQDQTRAAIDSIIQPVKLSRGRQHYGSVLLPPITTMPLSQQQTENEKELQTNRMSLLLMMKRLKLCLQLTNVPLVPSCILWVSLLSKSISALILKGCSP